MHFAGSVGGIRKFLFFIDSLNLFKENAFLIIVGLISRSLGSREGKCTLVI